ncbi:MAG: cation transporter [Lachnospiraceae bacterium]|uniref:Cation transporter n=1 Tax=Candidatus Weimeria bifida TaxID=2599074 RepID=A0A6N7IYD7_9FIRM|nr:cation transporter [Candidatus Weimeria bifida]RRF95025.1 MAG: cation transporter [Lachnospiraceae bacterium]
MSSAETNIHENEVSILQPDQEALKNAGKRDKQIVKTSVIAILANVLLAAFKAVIGVISGSIAITLDAVNNLSDAVSSVITIIGTKLATKEPDRKHPYGYGRIEYLSALIISVIVLYAGVTSLKESVTKIIHPETPSYTAVALIIVATAVLVKIFLGRYVESVGKRVNSDSLINSGKDATLDSIISASTLVAAVIFLLTKVSLESWLGAIISIVIIKSGIDMLREIISEILGQRSDNDLSKEIKAAAMEFPEVNGVYDLVLHNYGPDSYIGSFHIEVPDTLNAGDIDRLIRKITYAVYIRCRIIVAAISVYSINTKDQHVIDVREKIREIAGRNDYIIQMHGFYMSEEDKMIRFDLVVSFDSPDRFSTFNQVVSQVKEAYPDYKVFAVMDTDYSVS